MHWRRIRSGDPARAAELERWSKLGTVQLILRERRGQAAEPHPRSLPLPNTAIGLIERGFLIQLGLSPLW
jgi:hypothetical protein